MSEPVAEVVGAGTGRRVVEPVLLSVAIFWGTGNVAIKWMLHTFDPAALFAARMVVIAAVMAGIWFARRGPISRRDWVMLVTVYGVMVGAQQLGFAYAARLTTASEGSLLVSIAPLWTALLAAALGMEIIGAVNWLGIALAIGGVCMVLFGGSGPSPDAPARLTGDLIMIGSSLIYGGYMVASKRLMDRIGALPVVCLTFMSSAVLIMLVGWRQVLATDWAALQPAHWFWLFFLAIPAGAYGLAAWYRSISRTTASGVAVYQYLVPVVSVVVAAIFLRERMAVVQISGVVVTLIGVYLARLTVSRRAARVEG